MSDVRKALGHLTAARGGLAWAGAQVVSARVEGKPEVDALISAARDDILRMMEEFETIAELLQERG